MNISFELIFNWQIEGGFSFVSQVRKGIVARSITCPEKYLASR
jgi:hypothetical protein